MQKPGNEVKKIAWISARDLCVHRLYYPMMGSFITCSRADIYACGVNLQVLE